MPISDEDGTQSPSRDLVRTYYYAAPLPPDHDAGARQSQQKFFGALQRVPYMELRLGKLVKRATDCPNCGDHRDRYQEKGVDMRIGVDMLAGFALLARVRIYGGDFEIARNIRLTDNDFEIVVLERNRFWDYVRFLFGVILNRLDKTPGVCIVRGNCAEITALSDEPVHVQADGEAIGLLPAKILIVPDAVTLLLPKRYAKG